LDEVPVGVIQRATWLYLPFGAFVVDMVVQVSVTGSYTAPEAN
jgi:hypothetical protein